MNYVRKLGVLNQRGKRRGRDGAGRCPQEVVHQGGQVTGDVTGWLAGSIGSEKIL